MVQALYLQFQASMAEQVAPIVAGGMVINTKNVDGARAMVVLLPDGKEQLLARSSLFSKVERVPNYALEFMLGDSR